MHSELLRGHRPKHEHGSITHIRLVECTGNFCLKKSMKHKGIKLFNQQIKICAVCSRDRKSKVSQNSFAYKEFKNLN